MSTLLLPVFHTGVGLGIVLPSVAQHPAATTANSKFGATKAGGLFGAVPDFSPILAHFLLDGPGAAGARSHYRELDLDLDLDLDSSSASSSEEDSPVPARTGKSRRVTWSDNSGSELCKVMPFYRWDEPWRCSTSPSPPVSPRIVSPPVDGKRAWVRRRRSEPHHPPRLSTHPSSSHADKKPTFEFDTTCLAANDQEMTEALGETACKLESVTLRHPIVFLTIRVLNLAFEKSVFVRVTSDNWATHHDVKADFLPSSVDPRADRFYASISVPSYDKCSQLQFAICYTCGGQTYWDSNGDKNYVIRVNKPTAETLSLLQSFADGMSQGISPFVRSQ
jgi:hypothetical protein